MSFASWSIDKSPSSSLSVAANLIVLMTLTHGGKSAANEFVLTSLAKLTMLRASDQRQRILLTFPHDMHALRRGSKTSRTQWLLKQHFGASELERATPSSCQITKAPEDTLWSWPSIAPIRMYVVNSSLNKLSATGINLISIILKQWRRIGGRGHMHPGASRGGCAERGCGNLFATRNIQKFCDFCWDRDGHERTNHVRRTMYIFDIISSVSESSKCIKIVGGWGFSPNPTGELTALPKPHSWV